MKLFLAGTGELRYSTRAVGSTDMWNRGSHDDVTVLTLTRISKSKPRCGRPSGAMLQTG